jgi:hypothetical protein
MSCNVYHRPPDPRAARLLGATFCIAIQAVFLALAAHILAEGVSWGMKGLAVVCLLLALQWSRAEGG